MSKANDNPILAAIPFDRKATRTELVGKTGFRDRTIRKLIEDARKVTAILSNSTEKGYRRAKPTDRIHTRDEALLEIGEIQHTINEIQSRMEELRSELRPLIAHEKVLEKHAKKLDITSTESLLKKSKNIIAHFKK